MGPHLEAPDPSATADGSDNAIAIGGVSSNTITIAVQWVVSSECVAIRVRIFDMARIRQYRHIACMAPCSNALACNPGCIPHDLRHKRCTFAHRSEEHTSELQ